MLGGLLVYASCVELVRRALLAEDKYTQESGIDESLSWGNETLGQSFLRRVRCAIWGGRPIHSIVIASAGSPSHLLPLKVTPELRDLAFSFGTVDDLSPLNGHRNLKSLMCIGGMCLDSVEPLRGIHTLESLSLRHTSIDSIEPLSGLTALKELDIAETNITDLSPLRALVNLEKLSIRGIPARDKSVLKHLTKLKTLDITVDSSQDASLLVMLPQIENLTVEFSSKLHSVQLRRTLPASLLALTTPASGQTAQHHGDARLDQE